MPGALAPALRLKETTVVQPSKPSTPETNASAEAQANAPEPAAREPYSSPRLTLHGSLLAIVMSPSPGTFESGPGPGFRTP